MKKIEEEQLLYEKKSVIFVSLFRAFDIRLMLNTGIAERLSKNFKVVLLVPIEFHKTLRRVCNNNIEIETLQYGSSKYESGYKTVGVIQKYLESLIRQIFSLTYVRKGGYENLTRSLHVATYRKNANSVLSRVVREAILTVSWISCRVKIIRMIILALSTRNLLNNLHKDIYNKWHPSAIILCSVGLELDARLIVEFRKYKVPSITVVQSWDKTSSKGYPLAMPDRVLVWSDAMAEECKNFLDILEVNIEVVGSPAFDAYFNPKIKQPKKLFIESLGLESEHKNIFCALNTPSYHQGNLDLALLLSKALSEERFSQSANLILRIHPAYYENSDESITAKRVELLNLLNDLSSHPYIHVNFPDISEESYSYIINSSDSEFIANMLAYSDVSISILSTQMIESALFDCPSITIEYGFWSSNVLEITLQNFRLEHIERVLKTNAVSRARDPSELILLVEDCLKNRNKQKNERKDLVEQEVPVNRGNSAIKVIESIEKYLECHHSI